MTMQDFAQQDVTVDKLLTLMDEREQLDDAIDVLRIELKTQKRDER